MENSQECDRSSQVRPFNARGSRLPRTSLMKAVTSKRIFSPGCKLTTVGRALDTCVDGCRTPGQAAHRIKLPRPGGQGGSPRSNTRGSIGESAVTAPEAGECPDGCLASFKGSGRVAALVQARTKTTPTFGKVNVTAKRQSQGKAKSREMSARQRQWGHWW